MTNVNAYVMMVREKYLSEDRNAIPATMEDIDKLVHVLKIHNEVDSKIHQFLTRIDLDIEGILTRIEELENKAQ